MSYFYSYACRGNNTETALKDPYFVFSRDLSGIKHENLFSFKSKKKKKKRTPQVKSICLLPVIINIFCMAFFENISG